MDSVLINVPLSSPLHIKSNIVFLKSFIKENGFKIKAFDTNILFFKWMLRDHDFNFRDHVYMDSPVKLLGLYNQIEEWLAAECSKYRGLSMDLRTIGLAYDRLRFEEVLKALDDSEANPFIAFFDEFIEKELKPLKPRIVGIGLTFQDHIISAFTLADRLRKSMCDVKIVLGGQMITRCYDTMLESGVLNDLWDYLICWDGEIPFLDLHKKVISNQDVPLVNVIEKGEDNWVLDRSCSAFDLDQIKHLDFGDFDFNDYFFPDMLIPLETARGCYGSCEFCAIPSGSNTGFRERSVDKIINDIVEVQKHTLKKYGLAATYFKFMDDTSSPRTLLHIAEEIHRRGIDAKWETYVRMEAVFQDSDVMKRLYKGGCRKLMWGLETNDPEILMNMAKKIAPISTNKVLDAAHDAGILNFVFVLIGFPGEKQEQRDVLAEYIITCNSIHVLTLATFDVTKHSRMQTDSTLPDDIKLEVEPSNGFEVRLPYVLNGENWKRVIVAEAQRFMVKVTKKRPDIGLVSLFPDQVRVIYTEKHGNGWGKKFLSKFGEDKIKALLLATEKYIDAFENENEIELSGLPDPLKREHLRTKEDIDAIAQAIKRRKKYETKRSDSI